MSEANLDTTEERGDTGAISGEVGEVRSNQRRGGYWGFQHADEGITVDGLDDLKNWLVYRLICIFNLYFVSRANVLCQIEVNNVDFDEFSKDDRRSGYFLAI